MFQGAEVDSSWTGVTIWRVALRLFFPLSTFTSSILNYQVILAGTAVYFPAVTMLYFETKIVFEKWPTIPPSSSSFFLVYIHQTIFHVIATFNMFTRKKNPELFQQVHWARCSWLLTTSSVSDAGNQLQTLTVTCNPSGELLRSINISNKTKQNKKIDALLARCYRIGMKELSP